MADVRRDDPLPGLWVVPARAGACDVCWFDFGSGDIILEVGGGGRWELSRTVEHAAFVEEIVDAVVAGRVVEVFAASRSSVTVTLSDGTVGRTTVNEGPIGCLPLPGWTRWGRRLQYMPYVEMPYVES